MCLRCIYSFNARIILSWCSVGTPDRHFRSVGTLVLVCALAVIFEPRTRKAFRYLFLAFCSFMSLYGLGSFPPGPEPCERRSILDKYSRTSQPLVAQAALDFTRAAYVREDGDALFVLPSPDIAVVFPIGARIMSTHIDFQTEQEIRAMKYEGIVPGRFILYCLALLLLLTKDAFFLRLFRITISMNGRPRFLVPRRCSFKGQNRL